MRKIKSMMIFLDSLVNQTRVMLVAIQGIVQYLKNENKAIKSYSNLMATKDDMRTKLTAAVVAYEEKQKSS
jgi:hypothetical protein